MVDGRQHLKSLRVGVNLKDIKQLHNVLQREKLHSQTTPL